MSSDTRKKSGVIIIPARFDSTRFPGKPLAKLLGQSALSWTYRRACQNSFDIPVYITSESPHIEEEAERLGAPFIQTSHEPQNGTERAHEALLHMHPQPEWVINLQGDAVLFPLHGLNALIEGCLKHPERALQSLFVTLDKEEDLERFQDPMKVSQGRGTSVVLKNSHAALYFSKARLPFLRNINCPLNQHLGIYAYTNLGLKDWCSLAVTELEIVESLEQLRPLYHGRSIFMIETESPFKPIPSLDTPEDIPLLEQHLIQIGV